MSTCEADSEIEAVARALPANLVDVIMAGQTHAGMAHEINHMPVVEAFSGGHAFSRVDLTIDRSSKRVTARRVISAPRSCVRVWTPEPRPVLEQAKPAVPVAAQ